MTEALKELFKAYKNLPTGVLVFKDDTLFFVNEHLRSVLLLSNLPDHQIVEIIGEMLGLPSPDAQTLRTFLLENPFFYYRDRIIQIVANSIEGMDIFVLTRLSDATIASIDATRELRELKKTQESESGAEASDGYGALLKRILGNWGDTVYPSIVLYKGIPIKGECSIVEVREEEISIRVENKQLAAAEIGIQWLIGRRRDAMLSGVVSRYDLRRNEIGLRNLEEVSCGFHMRSVIRYDAGENDRCLISLRGRKYSFNLRDVSEKGISIACDDPQALTSFSPDRTYEAVLVLGEKKIEIRAVWIYTMALKGSMMKVAFTIGYNLHNGALIREWLTTAQLERIHEIRGFVQMLSTT
ncbi:MAG: hypothetical protein AB7S65_11115 [Sulfuricurvum sp.]